MQVIFRARIAAPGFCWLSGWPGASRVEAPVFPEPGATQLRTEPADPKESAWRMWTIRKEFLAVLPSIARNLRKRGVQTAARDELRDLVKIMAWVGPSLGPLQRRKQAGP